MMHPYRAPVLVLVVANPSSETVIAAEAATPTTAPRTANERHIVKIMTMKTTTPTMTTTTTIMTTTTMTTMMMTKIAVAAPVQLSSSHSELSAPAHAHSNRRRDSVTNSATATTGAHRQ
jgi:hypothetical protein